MGSFITGIIDGAKNLITGALSTLGDVKETLFDGISIVINTVSNIFLSINRLIEIFPIEIRPLLVTFFVVVSAYLIYKIVRGA